MHCRVNLSQRMSRRQLRVRRLSVPSVLSLLLWDQVAAAAQHPSELRAQWALLQSTSSSAVKLRLQHCSFDGKEGRKEIAIECIFQKGTTRLRAASATARISARTTLELWAWMCASPRCRAVAASACDLTMRHKSIETPVEQQPSHCPLRGHAPLQV